ncbi:MAG: conjugative coupling factor TraD, PFGI-1 class, partial [Candidatus Competibacteraceae bacterium]|nr:conjugative coupling factor TraD, PFGI-1 class [Candidatus Competibacteraceae bacterium]
EVEVVTLTLVSGANDNAANQEGVHFTSTNQDRLSSTTVPLLAAADVMALPKGQAFALVDGGRLWKIRIPLPVADDDPRLPADLRALTREMARAYRTGEGWWIVNPGGRD